jgi:hypothetical protein
MECPAVFLPRPQVTLARGAKDKEHAAKNGVSETDDEPEKGQYPCP